MSKTMPIPTSLSTTTAESAWARWVRLAAIRKSLWLQHLWSTNDALGASPHGEAIFLLQAPDSLSQQEQEFFSSNEAALKLGEEIEIAWAELNQDSFWQAVVQMFGLDQYEQELLAVCAAAEANPEIKRVFGYLIDQSSPAEPSPWIAAKLFHWPSAVRMHGESQLHRWRLAYPRKDQIQPWAMSSAWVIDPTVIQFLNGELLVDAEVATALHAVDTDAFASWPCLYEETREEIGEFLALSKRQPASRYEIELSGASGAGKRTFTAQVAQRMERQLLVIDCGLIVAGDPSPTEFHDRIARAMRTAALFHAVPYWHHANLINQHGWDALRSFGGIHFLGTEPGSNVRPLPGVVRRSFRLPTLTYQQRTDLWQKLTGQESPLPIQEWALRPSEIVAAAQVASAGVEAVHEVCRQRLQQEPGELFTVLPCPYDWEDFVLPPGIEAHLREFESQAKMRRSVYEDWGFEKHCPLGVGIAALFAGPSGTGKTMAAQVLARSLNLQLFKVDLASVLNKYVGETEKRLRSVFERCQRSNVMLFFDEADALFGHRVQTKDAQDRFANIEIDYLLQQMESYSGIAVLATNRKSELDAAFLRRLRFVVDFLPPSPTERARLWKLALLHTTPNGESLLDNIDWDYLALKLNLTGAEIKNSAISAAFLAKAEGKKIGMRHVMSAVRRELTKQGVVLRPGDWENTEWQS